jgi:hypothetical protein
MKSTLSFLWMLLAALCGNAQTGPGGIGDTSGNSALQLWVAADSANVNTNMSLADTLFDMSGAGNHLYSSGSNRPVLINNALNGQPVLQFNGSKYMETPGANASFSGTEATFFAVYTTYGSPSNGNAIIAVTPASWNNYFLIEKEYTYHIHNIPTAGHFSGRGHHCPMPDSGNYVIHVGAIGTSPSDLNTFMNNIKSTEAPYYVGSASNFTSVNRRIHVGYRQDWSSWLYGNLAELIGYNEKLSDSAIAVVNQYLMNKYNIVQGGLLSVTDSTQHLTCNGSIDGSITVTPQTGSSPYTYQWSTGDNSSLVDSLAAGTYSVTITDASGCAVSGNYLVSEPAALAVSDSISHSSCTTCCDGEATVAVTGGTPGYSYSWNDPGNQTSSTATGLCPGSYTVTVTDANGCTITDSVTISIATGLKGNAGRTGMSIYPNPFTDGAIVKLVNVSTQGGNVLSLSITDISGNEIKRIEVSNSADSPVMIIKEKMQPGIYLLRLKSGDRTLATEKIIVQ